MVYANLFKAYLFIVAFTVVSCKQINRYAVYVQFFAYPVKQAARIHFAAILRQRCHLTYKRFFVDYILYSCRCTIVKYKRLSVTPANAVRSVCQPRFIALCKVRKAGLCILYK